MRLIHIPKPTLNSATPYIAPGTEEAEPPTSSGPQESLQRGRRRPAAVEGGTGAGVGGGRVEGTDGRDGRRERFEVGRMYRLSPTEAPDDFDVISGVYSGPPPASIEKDGERGSSSSGSSGSGSDGVVGR